MFEIFKLNLDTDDFTKKLGDANKLIGSVFSGASIDSFVKGLATAGELAGTLGVAYLAVKNAVDWVQQAEDIKSINKEFEILTQQAGIATEKLSDGLKTAAGGLIEDTDLLKIANKAIVEMGASASKLPEIMEVARKSTAVFGGDLSQNFETLNRAIATGNERMLKSLGIVIDHEKAQKAYAASIGTTVSALSQQEKQQATLSAVIEKGRTAFQGIDVNAREASNTLTKIGVNLKAIWESIVLLVDKAIGPLVKAELGGLNAVLESIAKNMKSAFGQETASESVNTLSSKLHTMQYELQQTNEIIEKMGGGADYAIKQKAKELEDQISRTRTQLHAAMEEAGTLKGGGAGASGGESSSGPAPDLEKRRQQEDAFQKDLRTLHNQTLDDEMKNADSIEEVNRIHEEKRIQLAQDAVTRIQGIRDNDKLTEEQKTQEIGEINAQLTEKLKGFDDDLKEQRLRSIDVWEKKQVAAGNSMSGAMAADSKRAQANLTDFQKTGHTVFNAIGSNAKAAFKAMGDGSKDAAGAMRGFIMGAIADTAEAKGEEMLLAGIWPPNPAAIAGGGALIALSEVLRSQSQGSQGIGAAGGGGGGGNTASPAIDTGTQTQDAPKEKKNYVIAFNGPVINTEQTRQWMADTIRANTDVTDFEIKQLGI